MINYTKEKCTKDKIQKIIEQKKKLQMIKITKANITEEYYKQK